MVFKDCHQVMVLLKHGKEMERIQVQSSYVNSYHLSSTVTEKLLGIQGTNFITGVGQMWLQVPGKKLRLTSTHLEGWLFGQKLSDCRGLGMSQGRVSLQYISNYLELTKLPFSAHLCVWPNVLRLSDQTSGCIHLANSFPPTNAKNLIW